MPKFYITRWALTDGIIETEQEEPKDSYLKHGEYGWIGGKGKSWHCSLGDAKKAAEAMRRKRIKSLKEQIAKLEKLEF